MEVNIKKRSNTIKNADLGYYKYIDFITRPLKPSFVRKDGAKTVILHRLYSCSVVVFKPKAFTMII